MAVARPVVKIPFNIEELAKSSRTRDCGQTDAVIIHINTPILHNRSVEFIHTQQKRKRSCDQSDDNSSTSRDCGSPSSFSDESDSSDQSRKKSRTTFSNTQVIELEKYYGYHKYLQIEDRPVLARKLKLSQTQIKWWFQNRRMKEKRQIKSSNNTVDLSQFVGVGKPGSRPHSATNKPQEPRYISHPQVPLQMYQSLSPYGMATARHTDYNNVNNSLPSNLCC